jgi:hypothetical protein
MEQQAADERGQRRRLSATAITLMGIIAIAGAAGIGVSLAQRRTSPNAMLPMARMTPGTGTEDPGAWSRYSVADDLATHDVVLFGGVDDYAGTWLWNGAAWTRAHPATSPPGRFGASAAYDPETRTVLLYGGRNELRTPIHDTWAWDGTDWEDLDSGAGGPQPGDDSDMAWDAALNEMVLITESGSIGEPGDTWIWAGTHWRRPQLGDLPAGAFYSPMWFDPHTKSLIAVGCCKGPPPSTGAVNTTWRWNGSMWSLLSTPKEAPIDASTMALDPGNDALVLCTCGSSVPSEPDLLQWNGSAWAPADAASLPIQGGVEVTDLDRHELLLLGAPSAAAPVNSIQVQVWALSGSAWRRIDRPSA